MAEIISGIYKIINTITGDFYIGSSKNVKERWSAHKRPSVWDRCPNNPMYLDMKKYRVDSFDFEILEEVEESSLKEAEQKFIELLKPTYNSNRAKGLDVERYKEYQKSDKYKEYMKEYYQKKSNKRKKYQNKYNNQPCCYNGEKLTFAALKMRFKKYGIAHPTQEAKKYLIL